ncbi:MAG: ANTAR domain-containing protein [Kineosporiaceae bacterium]
MTGLVVVPGEWGGSLPLLFTVYLKELPDEAALAEIASLEQVLSQAVAVVEAAVGQEQRADQMLRMSQYRRVVEQAKGMVMAAVPTDSASAFSVLSRASQHFNVRLRHLAVALVEHVGTGPAEHPDDDAERVEPSEHDRTVAAQVWRALQAGAQQSDPGDPPATEASWRV